LYLLSNATSGISPTTNQSVGSPHDIPVKEASSPYLTRHKAAAEDTDEETNGVQTSSVMCRASKNRGYGTEQEYTDKRKTRSKSVAQRTGNETDNERRGQRDDVRVGHFILRKVEIFLNSDAQLKRN
jgi:hypothetical protein